MKTNVSIELNDEQRMHIADLIDGKSTSRLATRKDVVTLCQQYVAGLAAMTEQQAKLAKITAPRPSVQIKGESLPIHMPDPEDVPLMGGRHTDPGFVRGWNTVKRGGAS